VGTYTSYLMRWPVAATSRRVPTSIGWPVAGAALGEAPVGAQGTSLRCFIEQVIRRSDSKPGAHLTGASFAKPQSSHRPPGAEVGTRRWRGC
jgi:hypothetical protein